MVVPRPASAGGLGPQLARKPNPLDELLPGDPEARVPSVSKRGSAGRRPEVARACPSSGSGHIREEPHG
eukprot:9518862-Alexandrium_andersonii.AAC.1